MPRLLPSSARHPLWIALRRSRHDPVARAHLLRVLAGVGLPLLPVAVWIGWLIFKLLQVVGFTFIHASLTLGAIFLFFAVSVILGLVMNAFGDVIANGCRSFYEAFRRRWLERRMPAVTPELKLSLYRETCLLAILLERLQSEMAMEKELPPDIVVTTRRVHLDRLSVLGLRHELEPWLLDLLLAPDGHWTTEQKRRAGYAWESFAVLDWTLGLGELRGLTVHPEYDYAHLQAVFTVVHPADLIVVPPWDIRLTRERAGKFVNRCWYELKARGETVQTSDEDVAQAIKIREEIQSAGYTRDYLVGVQTIPEVDTPLLFGLFVRAFHRWKMLALLVEVTAGRAPVHQIRMALEGFFSTAETTQ